MKLTGIILSGGKSSRMGREKGTSLLMGKPLIDYAVDVLSQICEHIIIGANTNDYNYLGYPVAKDEVEDVGPIGGIYSCLKSSQTEDNLVLSCDMPLVPVILMQYIYSEKGLFDAVIPVFKGFQEPLCAYYNKSVTAEMQRSIENRKYKIQDVAGRFNTKLLTIDSSFPFYQDNLFTNINSPEDLKKVELLLSGEKK